MYTKAPKTTNEHDITIGHIKTKTPTHNADQRGLIPSLSLTQENILQLQRTIGNSAVMQLLKYHLQQPPSGPPIQSMESEEDEIDMLPDHAIQMAGDLEEEEEIQMKQDNITIQRSDIEDEDEIQMKHEHTNNTGMPDNLSAGLETLSGLDISDVHVHSNSDKPAQVGALAYTQGTDIYVAPGQEKHLPHEGWHAVQQKQGRVQATTQAAGLPVNDESALEHEADVMGDKALQMENHKSNYKFTNESILQQKRVIEPGNVVQLQPAAVNYAGTDWEFVDEFIEGTININGGAIDISPDEEHSSVLVAIPFANYGCQIHIHYKIDETKVMARVYSNDRQNYYNVPHPMVVFNSLDDDTKRNANRELDMVVYGHVRVKNMSGLEQLNKGDYK